jgi:hypothetical protein
MKVCITGASGFIGRSLIQALRLKGHQCIAIRRELLYNNKKELTELLAGCEAVINLAGAPILQRWTEKNKAIIYGSRVLTSRNLAEAIQMLPQASQPKILLSASAVGIYKTGAAHDDTSQLFDQGFTGKVVRDWENASEKLEGTVRRVIFRTGVVLGKQSQTIKKLKPLFLLGLGGKVGSGQQAFPFIHIQDLVTAFAAALTDTNYQGIYNLVAPDAITNAGFTRALGRALNRPVFLPVPSFALKLWYGEAAMLLLKGSFVTPKRLQEAGFQFKYPTIEKALTDITST